MTEPASTIHLQAGFLSPDRALTHKFLFPFTIPGGSMLTALHGTVSTSSHVEGMSETLISLRVATSAACPRKGEDIAEYSQILSKYPGSLIGLVITKQAGSGDQTVRVDTVLPLGVPLGHSCGYIVFDGSDFRGGPYTMNINLVATVAPVQEPLGQLKYSSQDEFILGDDNVDNAFKITHILSDTKLFGIFGNLVATTLPGTQYKPPEGMWRARHKILLYRKGCSMFPNQDQDSNRQQLDASMAHQLVLFDTTIDGSQNHSYYQPVQKTFNTPIILHQGDCIIHSIHSGGSAAARTGAFNNEAQLLYETLGSTSQ